MKRSTSLVLALVLLGGAGIVITRLMLDNYSLKVEVSNLRNKQAAQAKAPLPRPAPVAAAAPSAAASGEDRAVIESARQLMVDALSQETGTEKKFWLRVDPRDREASAFAGQIAAVFRDQGWDAKVLDSEGLRFKPGLLLLIGDEEEPPSYVVNAQKALEAIGQEMTTGRGYRSYYETKKRETPEWPGTKFLPEQTFVLLVGRKPEARPAGAE